jgi:hypothetical protein
MKKIFAALLLVIPAVVCADNVTQTASVTQTAAVTRTAQPAGDYDGSKYTFGDLGGSGTTLCAHKNVSSITLQDLSPRGAQDRWYFKIRYKDKPSEVRDVIGLVEYTKNIDGQDYYFFGVPLENKGNLVRFTNDGTYIRNLKYPVFSFIFLDVLLDPQIKYLQFPMKPGDRWDNDSEGAIDILALFRLKMKTTAKFDVMAVKDVPVDGRMLHVYMLENFATRGTDGKIFREEDWFGAGVGLMYIDTETYTLELKKFVPGPDSEERFRLLTVPITAKN